MKRTAIACVVGLLVYLVAPIQTFGQVSATVAGTVFDATGALIPAVDVTATNVNTGIVTGALSNETGNYAIPALQPGTYTLSATLPGFQSATSKNVQLSQGQQIRLNFTLQVATSTTAVDVVAESTLLLATTPSVGNVLAEREVSNLPVPTRNVLDLLGALPGVSGHNNVNGNSDVHFAGTATSQINTTRDGLTTTDGRYDNGVYASTFTSSDLVEEVQVVINSVDASSGRGSGQVRMQTRSGSNAFHGAAFYQNNNSAFNSQTWFNNLVGGEKDFQNRNQFGGRIGGPIKQNKAFFFVLYDGQRYVEKVNVTSSVLTGPARQGIFRYLTQNATGANGGSTRVPGNAFATTPSVDINGKTLTVDPFTGVPLFMNSFNLFSDVKDPNRTRIDPRWVGPEMLTRMPIPNDWTTGDGLNTAGYRWIRRHDGLEDLDGTSQTVNRDNLSARLDYQITTKNKVNFTMTREHDWGVTGQTGLPALPAGYFGDVQRVPYFYTASWTSVISPAVLNEFTFGRKQDSWQGTSPFDKGCCWGGKGENEIVDTAKAARNSFPQVDGQFVFISGGTGLSAYAPFGTSSPRNQMSPLTQFVDKVSWTKGRHAFQGGVEIYFNAANQNNHGAAGVGTTRPLATLGIGNVPVPNITTANFAGINSNSVTTAQNLLATLAGTVASVNMQYFINDATQTKWLDYRDTFIRIRNLRKNDWAAFWKDTWNVTGRLTVNMGLRYDKYGTPYDATGLAGRPKGGQASLFGISGTGYDAMWNPYAAGGALTTVELAGKGSPNPNMLLFNNDWTDFAPSIGFSYSVPWFKRSTVLRGGYGINYSGASSFLAYSANIGNIPGSTLSVTTTTPGYLDISMLDKTNIPLSTGGALPFGPVPLTNRTAGLTGYADNRKTPYIQSFNMTLQRELTKDLSATVSWVATKGTKLWTGEELNYTNIFENGILDAFNVTRAGGDAPLFDKIFNGLNVPAAGVVNGTTLTGSQALRRYTSTNAFLANGDVGGFASFLNSSAALTTLGNGGLLRRVGLPENFIVVNPQFGSVQLQGNSGNSTYHALQAVVTKRLSQGFSSEFSYSFSKALGDGGVRNPRNRSLSKTLQGFDRTHGFKAHGTWTLPFGPKRAWLGGAPSWVSRIVEDWSLSGIFSRDSGAALGFTSGLSTLSSRASNTMDLVGALPANLGKVEVGNGFVQYLNGLISKSAPTPNFGGDVTLPGRFTNFVAVDASGNIVLQNPAPGTTGNMSSTIGSLKGPASLGLDISLSKAVRILEGKTFTIRADAINFLNTPQWGNPNTSISSTNFGRITTAEGSRTITINARVDF